MNEHSGERRDQQFLAVFAETAEFAPSDKEWKGYVRFNLAAVDRGRETIKRLEMLREVKGARALDIGAGSGGLAIALAEGGAEVDAIEPDPVRFRWAQARIRGHAASVRLGNGLAEQLPFENETFDIVTLDSVIEHVEDPDQVVREVARVLRPGGIVYVVSPNKASLLNILRDPHYQMFAVVLLPRSLGKLYVERVRRTARGYWVNVIPTKRWLVRNFSRVGVDLEQLTPDGFEKLNMPTVPIRAPAPVRLFARILVRVRMGRILHRLALAQYPGFILLGRKTDEIWMPTGFTRESDPTV